MATSEPTRAELGGSAYELFVGALSILAIVNVVLYALLRDEATKTVVRITDVVLSIVFLVDFLVRLRRAPSKAGYFFRDFGWADLLSVFPYPAAKLLRLFRLQRAGVRLRKRGTRRIIGNLVRDRAGSALLSLLLLAILMLEFGGIAILSAERGAPNASITTAGDAMWFIIVTMATVGYGDVVPVTNAGREIGVAIIILGVAIFGTLTGYLANRFTAAQTARATAAAPVGDVHTRLNELKALVTEQQAMIEEIERDLRRE
jgi:voltage-gated potassium channel